MDKTLRNPPLDPPDASPPPLWVVLFAMPLGVMAAASVYVPFKLHILLLALGASIALAAVLARLVSHAHQSAPPSKWAVGSMLLVGILAMAPIAHMAVAPGADQAMYSAMGRAIVDSHKGLSAAWGDVAPLIYPRAYPALIALLDPIFGPAKASLAAAGSALLLFALAVGTFLRTIGLGPLAQPYAAVITLVCLVPQRFFDFGGNATTLAFAFGFLGSARSIAAVQALERPVCRTVLDVGLASLFYIASLAAHPSGALAAIGFGIASTVYFSPPFRLHILIPPLMCAAAFLFAEYWGGPIVSPAEAEWIHNWIRGAAEAVFMPAPLTPTGIVRALRRAFGLPYLVLVAGGIAAALLLPRCRRLGVHGLLALAAFWVLERLGPDVPLAGSLVYPHRWIPILAVALAIPCWAAHRTLSRRAREITLVLLLLLGVVCNHRWYQGAVPMAVAEDLAAVACLDRSVPPRAAIDGGHGDATQWIPALTGRLVTRSHVHVTLFDEYREGVGPITAKYRFVGAQPRYGVPAPVGGVAATLCQIGAAALHQLKEPVVVTYRPWSGGKGSQSTSTN